MPALSDWKNAFQTIQVPTTPPPIISLILAVSYQGSKKSNLPPGRMVSNLLLASLVWIQDCQISGQMSQSHKQENTIFNSCQDLWEP